LRLIIICNRHLSSPDLSLSTVSSLISHTTPFSLFVDRFYLAIYVVINMGISAFALSRELYSRLRSWSAGRVLFRDMLSAVLYAPMTFYDTTPLGRIINRFSKVCVYECVCVRVWPCHVISHIVIMICPTHASRILPFLPMTTGTFSCSSHALMFASSH
jgi:hypothetical protein